MQVRILDKNKLMEELKAMLLEKFSDKDVKIYLFGSWAKGKEKRTSDIDIGIWGPDLTSQDLALLRLEFEELTLPYRVDLVNLNKVESDFLAKVKEEGIVWKDYNTNRDQRESTIKV